MSQTQNKGNINERTNEVTIFVWNGQVNKPSERMPSPTIVLPHHCKQKVINPVPHPRCSPSIFSRRNRENFKTLYDKCLLIRGVCVCRSVILERQQEWGFFCVCDAEALLTIFAYLTEFPTTFSCLYILSATLSLTATASSANHRTQSARATTASARATTITQYGTT